MRSGRLVFPRLTSYHLRNPMGKKFYARVGGSDRDYTSKREQTHRGKGGWFSEEWGMRGDFLFPETLESRSYFRFCSYWTWSAAIQAKLRLDTR